MAELQFYRNNYFYPHYSETLTAYGTPMTCTPVGMNFKSGTLRVRGNMTDFMSCNYLAFTRDSVTLYAWVEDVVFRTEDSFDVAYTVDAWRTYKDKVNLGTQFIARRPETSILKDKLLGGSTDYPEITSYNHSIGDPSKRVFVVQVRAGSGELFSNSPVNPTPYRFYFLEYSLNNWTANTALNQLMTALLDSAEPANIVTMYSIPWVDISTLSYSALMVKDSTGNTISQVDGFVCLTDQDPSVIFYNERRFSIGHDLDALMRVDHSVQLVIPEAGIIDLPDELLYNPDLRLRQDIDIFSGACNYMLVTTDENNIDQYHSQSVRGSSISSIPVVSDPMDTYLSQNQNALATSLIGDVASIVGGVAVGAGLTPVTGGMSMALTGGGILNGINGITNRRANTLDAGNNYSNPPAFLGTALASNFNGEFWIITKQTGVENADQVHSNFGYPWGLVGALTFPSSGFIQTEGCSIYSNDGSVPKWALSEINSIFDNGILVH